MKHWWAQPYTGQLPNGVNIWAFKHFVVMIRCISVCNENSDAALCQEKVAKVHREVLGQKL